MESKITDYMRVAKKRKDKEKNESHKKRRKSDVIEKEDAGIHESYAPNFIYKNVKYKRKGTKYGLPIPIQRVFTYVQEHYAIPQDLEIQHKFGPNSGLTYEERVLRAFHHNLLQLKPQKSIPPSICSTCGKIGHLYKSCPTGF